MEESQEKESQHGGKESDENEWERVRRINKWWRDFHGKKNKSPRKDESGCVIYVSLNQRWIPRDTPQFTDIKREYFHVPHAPSHYSNTPFSARRTCKRSWWPTLTGATPLLCFEWWTTVSRAVTQHDLFRRLRGARDTPKTRGETKSKLG